MKTQIAAVEFGTSKIVTVVAQSGGMERCEIVGSGTVPYDGFLSDGWNNPQQLRSRLRDSIARAEEESKTRITEIYIGVPDAFTHVRSGEAEMEIGEDEIGEAEMNAVQDCVAERLQIIEEGGFVLHRSPAWFMVDDGKKTMAPLGLRGQKLSAGCTFMIADTAFIDEMTDIFGEMGITIMGFLSPSLGEALLLLSLDDRDRAALLIDVGYLSTEVSAVEGDAIVYHAILPLGGGHITAEIATDLAIPMRAAEQLKRGYVFNPDEFDKDAVTEVRGPGGRRIAFSRDEIAPSVQRVMDEICDMIDQTVRTDAGAHLGSRSQIFLTGGGISLMRGGREYLAERLGRPVTVPVAKSAKMNSPIYSSAMGLVDLIFDSIEQRDDTVGMGGKFKFSLFKKG